MLTFTNKRIHLACGATDMRKQINGLVAIIECSFDLNPLDAAIFVFCNRARDRVKILEWDEDGFWLYFKRLEGGRFKWPSTSDDGVTMHFNDRELTLLLEGPKVAQKLKRKELKINAII